MSFQIRPFAVWLLVLAVGGGSLQTAEAQYSMSVTGPSSVAEGSSWSGTLTVGSIDSDFRINALNSGLITLPGGGGTVSISSFDPISSPPPYATAELVSSISRSVSFTSMQDGAVGGSLNFSAYTNTGDAANWQSIGNRVVGGTVVNVVNVAPTITQALQNGTNGTITVNEGATVSLRMSSTDPGADFQSFTINGLSAGTGGNTGGTTRTSNTLNVAHVVSGTITNTFSVTDDDTTTTVTRTVNVNNVAPTLTAFRLNGVSGNLTVNEGVGVFASLNATDPGQDFVAFTINGNSAGTGSSTPGSTRTSATTNIGNLDQGVYSFVGRAQDSDGAFSGTITRTLTVLNLDPVIQSLVLPSSVYLGQLFNFSALATDFDSLFYHWDLDGDGLYNDFFGQSGSHQYATEGLWNVHLRVTDGEGGFAYRSAQIQSLTQPPPSVLETPAPASLVLFGSGLLGLLGTQYRRRTKQSA